MNVTTPRSPGLPHALLFPAEDDVAGNAELSPVTIVLNVVGLGVVARADGVETADVLPLPTVNDRVGRGFAEVPIELLETAGGMITNAVVELTATVLDIGNGGPRAMLLETGIVGGSGGTLSEVKPAVPGTVMLKVERADVMLEPGVSGGKTVPTERPVGDEVGTALLDSLLVESILMLADGIAVTGKVVLNDVGFVDKMGGEDRRGGELRLHSAINEVREEIEEFARGHSVTLGPVESAGGGMVAGPEAIDGTDIVEALVDAPAETPVDILSDAAAAEDACIEDVNV